MPFDAAEFSTEFEVVGGIVIMTFTDTTNPDITFTREAKKYTWPAVDENNLPITCLQYSPKQDMTGVTTTDLNIAEAQVLADRLVGRLLSVHKRAFGNGVA